MATFGNDVTSLDDLLVEQVKDMHSSEKQVESSYTKWVGKLHSDELKSIFNDRIEQARSRQNDLEQIADTLGAKAGGHKCKGTEGLLKEGDDFIGDAADNPVLDAGIIANAQRVEHYGIAGYGCAARYARTLGHGDAAQTLGRMDKQAGDFDKRMTTLAEGSLNQQAVSA